jgi:outer membrane protein assembly factor BamB
MLSKKSLFALTLMIVLTVPMMMQMSQTRAATEQHFASFLNVSLAPNPVGIGQTVYVSLFMDKPIPPPGPYPPPGVMIGGASLYTGLTIQIVPPSGTNVTLGPYTTDMTGGVGGITFTPTATGNYTFQGFYAGQAIVNSNYYIDPTCSAPVTLTVQQAAIPPIPTVPLPTSYWTRPIYASNYAWATTVGGNWYGCGKANEFTATGGMDATNNNFQPDSTAPTTAHILWTLPVTPGGQPGGTPGNEQSAICTTNPIQHYFEPIILMGVLYYNSYPAATDMSGIYAVNIRTGQTIWYKNTQDVLIYGEILTFHNNEDFGSDPMLWAANPNGNWDILDPLTGNVMATVTNIPMNVYFLGSAANALIDSVEPATGFYEIDSILIYYVNSTYNAFGIATASTLSMWNSSKCLTSTSFFAPPASEPSGTYSFSNGVEWSVPVPAADYNYTIAEQNNQAIVLSSYPLVIPTFAAQWGGATASDIAYNPITGAVLWGPVTQTLISGHEFDMAAIGDGVYVRHDKDTDQLYGYSLTTGKQIWGPTQLVGNALGKIFADAAIAYGQCYVWDFGGYVNAVNVTTGKLDWTWTRGSSGYNTPYGIYPLWVFGGQSIADGMIFLSEGRLYDPPLFPNGWKVALNCATGQLVWEINMADQRDAAPIADGEILMYNGYDGQCYAFGMGPSKTTVTAPDVGVTTATPVVITGTVMDISAGSQQNAVAANFPNGLPCVSDASMTQFMEAVYEQQPMPTNVTGVPVTVAVTDSNHNCYDIGTVYTDTSGTYSLTWTPIITGNYTVTATFAGTQSYYGSSAETHFYASAPPATAPPYPTPVTGLASTGSLELGIAAVIIVIVIIGVVLAILTVRKRP